MQRSNEAITLISVLFFLACLSVLVYGIILTQKGAEIQQIKSSPVADDSSITTRSIYTDSFGKIKVFTTNDTTLIHRSEGTQATASSVVTAGDNLVKKGYDLILLGLAFLLIFYAMPYLTEFSFLQLFSAKFRANVENQKAAANEATNATNTQVIPSNNDISEKPVEADKMESIRARFHTTTNVETYSAYNDDPQKSKWGTISERNGRKLVATVTPMSATHNGMQLFRINLRVFSTNPANPLTGSVKFHLHPTFAVPEPTIFVLQGVAVLELVAWGAFTVGAVADKGNTELELDLAELPDAPILFKSR